MWPSLPKESSNLLGSMMILLLGTFQSRESNSEHFVIVSPAHRII
uniref:Uncharacterized protein n=1 Tax=Tetraselmis sp. GSL018 TaxID=582737 RepID=A0A061RQD8_9CHLO